MVAKISLSTSCLILLAGLCMLGAVPLGEGQVRASRKLVDLTSKTLKDRLAHARPVVPVGDPEVNFESPSKKTSKQTFRILDGNGNWFTVTTSCSGQCSGQNQGCGVEGCDMQGGAKPSCSQVICTGNEVCTSQCTKVSTL